MQPISHPWDVSPADAIEIQKHLAGLVVRKSKINRVKTVAGIDTAYCRGYARAAVVVLDFPSLNTREYTTSEQPIRFPYVPGLLTFREGPAIMAAFEKLKSTPDLIVFDGQGVAHPRRFGIASHIGVLLDIPSIGCAKTRLVGQYREPGSERGEYALLEDKGDTIGAVVRTRTNVKPVFVSIGHRIGLRDSIKYVLDCCTRYRLPETTRQADKRASF
jgi:deoxyribonuclease V